MSTTTFLQPLVSICCMTYNHENFIRQCLDGFVMQKTTFPFEILLHEDASTDNTATIVREYESKFPNLFRCVYQTTNQFIIQNTLINILFPMAGGKYIALCEGDDYWIDPLKLQKQVDFLEANTNYGICWSKYYVQHANLPITTKAGLEKIKFTNNWYDVTMDNFYNQDLVLTLTCLFRKEHIDINLLRRLKYTKDISIYVLCLKKSLGAILDFYGATYREHPGGIYSGATEFDKALGNYRNIKEVNQFILRNNHTKLRRLQVSFLSRMFYLACHTNNKNGQSLRNLFYLYWQIVLTCPTRESLGATKEVIKQIFLHIFSSLKFA